MIFSFVGIQNRHPFVKVSMIFAYKAGVTAFKLSTASGQEK
jgi:hypothetical protein